MSIDNEDSIGDRRSRRHWPGAVVSMTRSLAQALGPMGINVNNIPPGSIMHT